MHIPVSTMIMPVSTLNMLVSTMPMPVSTMYTVSTAMFSFMHVANLCNFVKVCIHRVSTMHMTVPAMLYSMYNYVFVHLACSYPLCVNAVSTQYTCLYPLYSKFIHISTISTNLYPTYCLHNFVHDCIQHAGGEKRRDGGMGRSKSKGGHEER